MNQHTIPAIETRYAGCRFRSRLEARWAVFFDRLGVTWEYEPQGYALSSGWYLPDFRLPEIRGGLWFEVKPDDHADSDPRWEELVVATEHHLAVAYGMSRPDRHPIYGHTRNDGPFDMFMYNPEEPYASWDNLYGFCICPEHLTIAFEFEGRASRGCRHCGFDKDDHHADHPRILAAYTAARSARFEHGQIGAA